MGSDTAIDWDAEARTLANRICIEIQPAERGAHHWEGVGVTVIYGNDGWAVPGDPRAQAEVAELRRTMAEAGVRELGIGTSDQYGDFTWVLVAATWASDDWHMKVWRAWNIANECDPDFEDAHAMGTALQ